MLSGLTVEELEQRETIARAHLDRAIAFGAEKKTALVTELLRVAQECGPDESEPVRERGRAVLAALRSLR